ncbi:DUF6382 domain-containing protein [Paenibacillus sp. HW567]|uniref:DUF6382 domain-containing protein n=1 Tax=Paenibacillus sp. HW567 TaxID=1034769 RepID=UPI00036EFF7B|nr:DUF6382 domain-containing protein [Paenibacillus sp. HW567]
MFGLSRDFVQQDGFSLLLSKSEGLRAEDLNMVQARMLMNTGIPHHLRLLLREIDLQVTLEYSLSRRKMLSHLLKSEKLSLTDLFGLLLQIAVGMEEGQLYMLRAEQYALHEDYIFIEGPLRGGKVFLTYLPLLSAESAVRPGDSLKSLIMVLMSSVSELSGDGVQRLLQYCGGEEFTPTGLKELLAELLTDGDGAPRYRGAVEPASNLPMPSVSLSTEGGVRERNNLSAGSEPANPERGKLELGNGNAAGEAQSQASWMNSYPRLRLREEEPQPQADELGSESPVSTEPSGNRTYVVLGGVLVDALLWKFLYLNNPKPLWLVVCGAVTLALAVLCWLVWSGRMVFGSVKAEEDAEGEAEDKRWVNHRALEWDFGRNVAAPASATSTVAGTLAGTPIAPRAAQKPDALVTGGAQAIRSKGDAEVRSQPAKASMPVPVEATTLLTRNQPSENERDKEKTCRAGPYLERVQKDEDGSPEKIELNRPSFLIGRSPEVAQYVEKSEGASRVHAEILKGPGGYILKDLDSRNGTLFQGEAMIPYKEYPLTEGAEFTIVKGSYTFHSA